MARKQDLVQAAVITAVGLLGVIIPALLREPSNVLDAVSIVGVMVLVFGLGYMLVASGYGAIGCALLAGVLLCAVFIPLTFRWLIGGEEFEAGTGVIVGLPIPIPGEVMFPILGVLGVSLIVGAFLGISEKVKKTKGR